MNRRPRMAVWLGLASIELGACAPHPVTSARYPRLAPGCDITVYHTAVPGVALWDDLGIAEVGCHISTPESDCMRALKADACRMGGDLIYNVPRRPLRPQDQVMLFRGQVAHSRPGVPRKPEDSTRPEDGEDRAGETGPATRPDEPPDDGAKDEAEDGANGPVIPLSSPAAPEAEPGAKAAAPR